MTSTPAAATPQRRTKPRWLRYLRWLLIAYLLVALMLSLFQRWLIFPGAAMSRGISVEQYAPRDAKVFSVTLADGSRASALFAPARRIEGPSATIIYFYGNGQCMAHALDEVELFRSAGFHVLMGDYPGFGTSEGKPSEGGCFALADALWQWAQSAPEVDPRRIVAVGWSLGSGSAVDLASRQPVAALVTLSAFTSLEEMAREQFPIFPTGLFLQHPFRSAEKMRQVRCPVIMFHGTHDSIVPFAMQGKLAAAAPTPPRLIQVDSDHNDIIQRGWDTIRTELVSLRERLK
jgi:fermentation-respiration switch protein FrsA (DUF1100 family)